MEGGFEDWKIRFNHGHGNSKGLLPVPGRIQDFIWILSREEIQLDKLGIVEYELDLRLVVAQDQYHCHRSCILEPEAKQAYLLSTTIARQGLVRSTGS